MKVAVRTLCEFAARRGSLEYRYTPSPSSEEGIAGHLTLQKRRGSECQSEYLLEGECLGLTLRGRADGYMDVSPPLIEEIKTHRGDLSRIGQGQHDLHWAQLKVYGALLCLRDNHEKVTLRLTYYDIAADHEKPDEVVFDSDSLTNYLAELCEGYRAWHEQEMTHLQQRDDSLMGLTFPYPAFRQHQRELSTATYRNIADKSVLLLEAPTGIGKTLGTVFPALMAMPRKQVHRLFLLTCRTTGRQLFLNALQHCLSKQEKPVTLRVLELSAKDKLCEFPENACHGDSCPLAKGFFDRLPAARAAAAETQWLDVKRIQQLAADHHICPYFLSQEMARWCDVVIGDVNHYFDRQALLWGLTNQQEWQVTVMVDEAHNLIDRARAMYSASIERKQLQQAGRLAPPQLESRFKSAIRAWKRLRDKYISEKGIAKTAYLSQVPTELNNSLQKLVSSITDYLSENPVIPELQQLLFDIVSFLKLAEKFSEHSLCSLTVTPSAKRYKGENVSLSIENLIPADFLSERFSKAHSTVLFSATLTPANFYLDLLGCPSSSRKYKSASPFSANQIDLQFLGTSTRLDDRAKSIKAITQSVATYYQKQQGNYLVYVSSFSYLEMLYNAFIDKFPTIPAVRQNPGMSETERQSFIQRFSDERGLVGFAVLGGVFSEGIDLVGDALVGVFIATLGLPPL